MFVLRIEKTSMLQVNERNKLFFFQQQFVFSSNGVISSKKKKEKDKHIFQHSGLRENYTILLASCWAVWSICHSGFCYMVESVCAVYRTEVCSLNLNTISLTKLIRGLANHTLHTWGRWRWSKVIVMVTFLQIHKDRQ